MKYMPERKRLCAIGRKMWEKGWVAANDGNISMRCDKDRFLITPSNVSKGELTPDMILNLEIHIGEMFKKSRLGNGVFYDQTTGRWYIFPTAAETKAWEEGSHVVCAHFTYHNGETYIKDAGHIMVSSCG